MSETRSIEIAQDRETPIYAEKGRRFFFRYAYARSADSKLSGDLGQDFLILREDENRMAFVLCDGVSQSFYGDIAARILGKNLLIWLWNNLDCKDEISALEEKAKIFLLELTGEASQVVQEQQLADTLSPMVQAVLEKKRAQGSESTFVSGLIDSKSGTLTLVWMGDSRLRIWGKSPPDLGETLITRERWSTLKGPVGQIHASICQLKDIQRLIVYSDGFAILDQKTLDPSPENQIMDQWIAETAKLPSSDDVSFLEIWVGKITHRGKLHSTAITAPLNPPIQVSDPQYKHTETLPLNSEGVLQPILYDEPISPSEFDIMSGKSSVSFPTPIQITHSRQRSVTHSSYIFLRPGFLIVSFAILMIIVFLLSLVFVLKNPGDSQEAIVNDIPTSSLKVRVTKILDPPTLDSPKDKKMFDLGQNILFRWSSVVDAKDYLIKINFEDLHELNSTRIKFTEYQLDNKTLTPGCYTWQVQACNEAGIESVWSSKSKFCVSDTNTHE